MRDRSPEIAEMFAEAQELGRRYGDVSLSVEGHLASRKGRSVRPIAGRRVERDVLLWLAEQG